MADQNKVRNTTKKAVEPKGKVSFLTRTIDFFKRLPSLIALPFKNMWRELKKVTWPSRKDLVQYSLFVMAFMAFMGIVIGLLDMGASRLIALFVGA